MGGFESVQDAYKHGKYFGDFIKNAWGAALPANPDSGAKPKRATRKTINLQNKPAGRKVDPWNPIAFNILNDGNENSERRAFDYWCKEQGFVNPQRSEREAFKKAMKREEERRRRIQ
jgi:hypothetical protein